MSGVPPLTSESRPTPPDARVRRMRIARDACWVIVAASLGAAVLVLLDAAIHLPGWGRGLGLAVWVTTVGVLAWRLLLRRWDSESTTVANAARQELPSNLSAATAAAFSLVGCLLAGSLVPCAGEHLRRVALPWYRPAVDPYHVVVTSGDPVVRRGNPVTLSAYAEKTDPNAGTPTTGLLVLRDSTLIGERKSPMTGDGNGAFHATLASVHTDIEYRIEIGNATSDWFRITAMDAAEVATGSTIAVRPPSYAPTAATRHISGFVSFDAFQHTIAELRLRFTRPLSTALLEWQPEGGSLELPPLAIAADRLAAMASVRLLQPGTLRLITFTEHNGKSLRWETSIRVRVKPDEAPRFERLAGVWVRAARPGERLRIELTAADDIAIGSAALEYLTGSGDQQPAAIPIPLAGAGTANAEGRLDFDLSGKGADAIRFRIRICDTRQLDESQLKPQVSVFPANGWITVRLDSTAAPQESQDILGQREVIAQALTAAHDEARGTRTDAAEIDAATAGKTNLTLDQTVRLRNAQERTRKLVDQLEAAGRIAALAPDLRPLAGEIRAVANGQLKNADAALTQAVTENPTERAAGLSTAVGQLLSAEDHIEELTRRNQRLAQGRLDRAKIAALAAAQSALADRAGADAPAEELARLQHELLGRLRKLVAESDTLRPAAEAARAAEFRRLVVNANELAEQVRELDAASKQMISEAHKELLAAILKEHGEATAKAAALLRRIETPARLINIRTPQTDDFRRIARLMDEAQSLEALTELQKIAQELETVAALFEKWTALRSDPKAAARELAAWQDDLHARFRTATGGTATTFSTLPDAVKAAFRSEQATLRAAVAALRVPTGDHRIRAAQDGALEHLAASGNFLAGNGANADTAMKAATEYLNQLAENVPTVPERLRKTRGEFEKLRQEQDSIQIVAEQALRGGDPTTLGKRLGPAHDRQRKQQALFAALDLPGFDNRRERIIAALAAAVGDLRDGSPLDVVASQAWVKREFDRLKLVFDGSPSPDDKADELARRVAKVIAVLGPAPSLRQAGGQLPEMQEIQRQIEKLQAPESPLLLNEARDAVQTADLAFRNNSKPDVLVRRLTLAAASLARLADRLDGTESDLDRVRRLAANRRAGAEEARKLLGMMPPPGLTGEVARQLGREIEELTHTRVGAAGQPRKRQLLDQYAKLKDGPTPEKWAGIHAAIAEKLDELAALMADVGDLNATFDRTPPAAVATDTDAFLPSKPLAVALRDLAKQLREIHTRLTNLPTNLAAAIKPADGNAAAALVEKHRKLAARVQTLVARLDLTARNAGLAEPAGNALSEAATSARGAERWLGEAAAKVTDGQSAAAEKFRDEAAGSLAGAAIKLAGATPELTRLPEPAELATGEALLAAEAAMRQAIGELGAKPDRASALKAMQAAGEELKKAAKE